MKGDKVDHGVLGIKEDLGYFEKTGFLMEILRFESGNIGLTHRLGFDFLTHALVALHISKKNRGAEVFWLADGKRMSTKNSVNIKDMLNNRARESGKKKIGRYNNARFHCSIEKRVCVTCKSAATCK